jgi:hypothetical protein
MFGTLDGYKTHVDFIYSKNMTEICTFFTFIHVRLTFLGHIALFLNFEAKGAKIGSKKSKTVFVKRVLDFHFAPITGSGFLIF